MAGLPAPEEKNPDDQPYVTSQRQLSERLTRKFQGKIICSISQTQIVSWLKGQLPDGCELPPLPVSDGYEVQAWFTWFEKYILPLPDWGFVASRNGHGEPSLNQRKIEAQAQQAIDEQRMVALNLKIKMREYKSVEVFNRHIASFFAEINAYIAEGERIMERQLQEIVHLPKLDNQERAALQEAIRKGVRAASDNFRSGLKLSLVNHTETTD